MSRAMDSLTQSLITDLCQLLEKHPTAALRNLEVSAPFLVERLEQVSMWAVDRRDIGAAIDHQLQGWLKQYPQPKQAAQSLLDIQKLVCPMFPHASAS